MRIHERLDSPDEVALEFMLGLDALLRHAGLAPRTILPVLFRYFIASNMYEFARKQLDYLGQNILQEFEARVFPRAKYSRGNRLGHVRGIRPAGATEFRIGSEGCA